MEKGEMSKDMFFLMIISMVGAALLVAYLRDVLHVLVLWQRGVRTIGVVVDNAATHVESGTRWAPVFAFTDRQGNTVTAKPIVRIDTKMELGRELPVVYLEHRPEVMLIFTEWQMVRSLLENSILLILGSSFLAVGVIAIMTLEA